MISLLYRDDKQKNSISKDTVSELMLDKIVSCFTLNKNSQKYFIDVLYTPLTNESDIKYRQTVTCDLIRNKSIVQQLYDLFSEFDELYEEYAEAKRKSARMNSSNDINTAVFHLNSIAFTLKKILFLLKEVATTVDGCSFTSEGMTRLCSRINEIVKSEAYTELIELTSAFENYSICGKSRDIVATINSFGKMNYIDLSPISESSSNNSEAKHKFNPFKKKKALMDFSVIIDNNFLGTQFIISAIKTNIAAMEFAVKSIIGEFGNLGKELVFYSVAVRYSSMLNNSLGNITFPDFGDDVDICGLCDMYLMFSSSHKSGVVPNDFRMDKNIKGIIIEGDNNCGKTVYLRSFVTAVIFAQAGLPIAAASAKLSIYKNIHVLMASAEKYSGVSDNYGGFEEEVCAVEEIVNSAEKGSLVIFNEVFQTTDYTEGAEGLYNILNYFSDCKIKWVIVTHLKRLSAIYEHDDTIGKLHTSKEEKYKIIGSNKCI